MRRHHAPLIAAGLAVALSGSAIAGPGANDHHRKNNPDNAQNASPTDEAFESFTVTSRARLGVMVLQLTPELREHFGVSKDRGVLVGRVEPGSAAAASGLAVGDIVTQVGGEVVEDATDVIRALAPAKKDEKVTIDIVRANRPLTLTATMRDEPSPMPATRSMRSMRWMRPMPFDDFKSNTWPRWFRDMFDDDRDSLAPPAPPAQLPNRSKST